MGEGCYSDGVRQLLLAVLASSGLFLPVIAVTGASPPPPPPSQTAERPNQPPAPPAKPAANSSQPQTPPAKAVAPEAGARTLSESGQFSILGGQAIERSEVAKRGDSHWKLFTTTAGFPPKWHHRIVVQVYDRRDTLAPQVRAFGSCRPLEGGGWRFQVDLLLDEDFRWDEFRRELTKLFLMSEIVAANPYREIQNRIPAWIETGLHTLMNYRQNGTPTEFFSGLLNTRQMLSVDELLKHVPSQFEDFVSSGIFSACSAALVQALFDQPNGRVRFQALLSDLGTSDKPVPELLQTHFPSLHQDPGDMEKWWTLQMANMSKQTNFEVLSIAETEKRLEDLLVVRAPAPAAGAEDSKSKEKSAPQKPPEAKSGIFSFFRKKPSQPTPEDDTPYEPVHLRFTERYLKRPWAKAVLQEKGQQLLLLQTQAFPLYRPLIGSYLQLVNALQKDQLKEIGGQLDQLEQDRQAAQKLMRGVEDYVNWFSTTQIEGFSQEFDGYSQALRLLEKLDQRKRPDPISRYLDAIERELNP